jgi:hypothetical protein
MLDGSWANEKVNLTMPFGEIPFDPKLYGVGERLLKSVGGDCWLEDPGQHFDA